MEYGGQYAAVDALQQVQVWCVGSWDMTLIQVGI